MFRLTTGAVTRLKTELPLQYGEVVVDTDNLAPGFAGAYGLWLKRAGRGWRLVFTNEPDVWGTQYDAAFDAAEIELAYSYEDASARPFGVALTPTGADRGRLVLHWGPHEWTAEIRQRHLWVQRRIGGLMDLSHATLADEGRTS